MSAEMKPTEQEQEAQQIQEKTISSQTEELKKSSHNADGNNVGNHVETEEEEAISNGGTDCGIADESPRNEVEADDGVVVEEGGAEGKEAHSGIEEEKPSEGIGAEICNMMEEAPSSGSKETHSSAKIDVDESMKTESVSSTNTVTTANPSTEEVKTNNGVAEMKEEKAEKKKNSLGSTVAKHYNDISPNTKEARKHSRIFHLRNFNNWIKSVCIAEYLEKIKRRKRISDDVNVLDLACGKGGDLLKWQKGKIDHVIMADIAAVSIDQCKERYAKLQKDQRNNRYNNRERLFTAEFFAADCTKTKLNELYRRRDIKLDLSSCQFAFHYSFESYEQADMMLKNLCENLRVGGYFIGTTPDAQKLVRHIKACKADSFGNSVFNIKPEDKDLFPLFGSKYMFYLEGVVDCPEFIVYLPLLEKMAAKYNMKLVWKKNFHEIFKEYEQQYASLLTKMSALEKYPAMSAGQLAGGSESQYKSAKDYADTKANNKHVGTLSADEWEVAGLYIAFAFEKVEPPRESKPKERDERKRPREDKGRRSDEHHRHHKSSESSNTPKRTRKDGDEEVYEIKDEIYGDDDQPSDKSKSEKSKEKTDSSRVDKSESEICKSTTEDKVESEKVDASKEVKSTHPQGEAVLKEDTELVEDFVARHCILESTSTVTTPVVEDLENVQPSGETKSSQEGKEMESTTDATTDIEEPMGD